MISEDFSEFPEHRLAFFKLLRAINTTCFPGSLSCLLLEFALPNVSVALLTLPPADFKLIMDSTVWAIKHTMRDISEIGLGRESVITIHINMA